MSIYLDTMPALDRQTDGRMNGIAMCAIVFTNSIRHVVHEPLHVSCLFYSCRLDLWPISVISRSCLMQELLWLVVYVYLVWFRLHEHYIKTLVTFNCVLQFRIKYQLRLDDAVGPT